jgi:hypothetical protein
VRIRRGSSFCYGGEPAVVAKTQLRNVQERNRGETLLSVCFYSRTSRKSESSERTRSFPLLASRQLYRASMWHGPQYRWIDQRPYTVKADNPGRGCRPTIRSARSSVTV